MTVQGPPKSVNLGLAASWARHAVPPTSARPKAATRVAALVRGTVPINDNNPCMGVSMTTSSPRVRAIPTPKDEGTNLQKISALEREGPKSCRGRWRLLLAMTGGGDRWVWRKGHRTVAVGGWQKRGNNIALDGSQFQGGGKKNHIC